MKALSEKGNPPKKYVFFISHSTRDIKNDVGEVHKILKTCKIPCYIADIDAPLGNVLPAEIKKAIEESELFLVFITQYSKRSLWVNQEIGYALGKEIPVIPLKKGRATIKGLIEAAKYVPIYADPLRTVNELFKRLKGRAISPAAQAAFFAFVGALKLKDEYGGKA